MPLRYFWTRKTPFASCWVQITYPKHHFVCVWVNYWLGSDEKKSCSRLNPGIGCFSSIKPEFTSKYIFKMSALTHQSCLLYSQWRSIWQMIQWSDLGSIMIFATIKNQNINSGKCPCALSHCKRFWSFPNCQFNLWVFLPVNLWVFLCWCIATKIP